MDGDGSPDWALCLDLLPPCKSNSLLMGIASSIMQTMGASQVWRRGLRLWRSILVPAVQHSH